MSQKASEKILNAPSLKGKYTKTDYPELGLDLNLLDAFQQFLDSEQFEDEQLDEEFQGPEEDSFFLDWLRENKGIEEGAEVLTTIWRDLVDAYNEKETADESPAYYWKHSKEVKTFNIEVDQSTLGVLDQEMDAQAQCLKAADQGDLDRATLSILQIGRQNRMPLFMWLADAFNRYRLQRRKYYKERMKPKDFSNKFDDKSALEFVQNKCKGFDKWLQEYQPKQRKQFMEKCQAAISVYFRRIIIQPPMVSRRSPDILIDDKLQVICGYIMQMYALIEGLCLKPEPTNDGSGVVQAAIPSLPYQMDVVIVPQQSFRTDDDEEDGYEDDGKEEGDEGDIGSIEERLKGEKYEKVGIQWMQTKRKLMPKLQALVNQQKFQRSVVIIDRRKAQSGDKAGGDDVCYFYKPSDKHKACVFEQDQTKFLPESLLINSRTCLIPSPKPPPAKPISTLSVETNPAFLTLQFHVYSADETRVYLSYDGWGTRFFIEDLRHYLPEFFVKKQREEAEKLFTEEKYKDFKKRYERTKDMCPDERFEDFYKNLINAKDDSDVAKTTGTPH